MVSTLSTVFSAESEIYVAEKFQITYGEMRSTELRPDGTSRPGVFYLGHMMGEIIQEPEDWAGNVAWHPALPPEIKREVRSGKVPASDYDGVLVVGPVKSINLGPHGK